MKFGFDLDGTLDREEVAEMARALYNAGHEIHVLTVGRLGPRYESTRELKELKLAHLKVPYSFLHLVEGDNFSEAGYAKAQIINREGIVTMIDDSSTMCHKMAEYTTAAVMHLYDGEMGR